jgi:hypothetical protein
VAEKPKVLAACPPFAFETVERAIGSHVRLLDVTSLEAAEKVLTADPAISLVLIGVHFDQSRMFDLLGFARSAFPATPVVCCRVLDAEIPKLSRQAIDIAARSLGAAGFVDLPSIAQKLGQEAAESELRHLVLAQIGTDRLQGARG